MKTQLAWVPVVLLGVAVSAALGQHSTAVQLPTYSAFNANTTVTVPDRGSVYLGGVKRAASGVNEFGTPLLPFRNRSYGGERSASSLWVSVYIHDFEAMDEYLLSQPTPFRASQRRIAAGAPGIADSSPPAGRIWQPRPETAAPGPRGPAAMSVAELRAKHLREQQTRAQDALKWFERGRNAEASGKANVARVYYQMAARRATGTLKDQIAVRLEAVGGSPAAPKIAQSAP